MHEVKCDCGHTAEIKDFADKRGWECPKCYTVWELNVNGKMEKHLFHKVPGAKYEPKRMDTVLTSSQYTGTKFKN